MIEVRNVTWGPNATYEFLFSDVWLPITRAAIDRHLREGRAIVWNKGVRNLL